MVAAPTAPLTVAIVGLGAIGMTVARGLDRGIPGLRLTAAAARDLEAARKKVAGFRDPPAVRELAALAPVDILVEAAGAAALPAVAELAIRDHALLVACSVGALMHTPWLLDRAAACGVRIVVPSGALGGLDAVRAAAEGEVAAVVIATRKPPPSLAGAPYIVANGIDLAAITEATCVFRGSARAASAGFPANLNVAAALALAGIGPERTQVEIWADPSVTRNIHTVSVDAAAVRMTVTLEGLPSPDNPRTSQLAALSVLATLRGLASPLRIGG